MRGSVLGVPLWLIVMVCVVPPIAYSLSRVAGNLYRYYDGVRTFNNEAALRDRMLERLFTVTGPATAGIFQSVKSSDKRLETWLSEVPPRLAILMRDIQHVLGVLGHMPGVIVSADDERRLQAVNQQANEAYVRWRAKHGDVQRALDQVDWDMQVQDDLVQ